MVKKFVNLLIYICVLCVFSGCGKSAALPIGNDTSDLSFLSEGRFREISIDTSFISGDFYENICYTSNDGYSYILSDLDFFSFVSKDYLITLDKAGNTTVNTLIDRPINTDGTSISISLLCDDASSLTGLSGDYEYSIYYGDYSFNDDLSFSGVCKVSASTYLSNGSFDSFSEYFNIDWDNTGKCISVSHIDEEDMYVFGQTKSLPDSILGNDYKMTNSGIILIDEKGQYQSEYFNFINSGIFSFGFNNVHIIDSDSFSGIYRNSDNTTVLSCFVRDNSKTDQKPIVIASSDLEFDFMRDVISYNLENGEFDITVIDYSDRSTENDPLEGWSLLKEDVVNGFRPDIILNTIGYDSYFESYLSSQSLSVDLKEMLAKDPELDGVKFTDKAGSLFYSGDTVYSIIPSYTYRTVTGDSSRLSSVKWDINSFVEYADSTDEEAMFFLLDYKDTYLKRLIEYNGSSYVDKNSKSASFDTGEFASFLKIASKLPNDYSEASNLYYWGLEPCDVLLCDQLCNGIGSMHYESTVSLRGGYTDLGFPVGTEIGSGVISAVESFIILSGRAYTNECWSFIRKYLTPEYQDVMTYGIPVTVSGFDAWSAVWYPDSREFTGDSYIKNGFQCFVNPVTDVDADRIIKSINECRRMEFMDYRVEQIVLEYAHQYFDGKITAEEAAAAIDRDVEAYLAS